MLSYPYTTEKEILVNKKAFVSPKSEITHNKCGCWTFMCEGVVQGPSVH